ncbi:MAG: DUF1611 domain-containing protein [Nitrosomonas sp.]|nr:DUF1611 domain-containing protein [Nitrosomonas sp.]
MNTSLINQANLRNGKIAYSARNVTLESTASLLHGDDVIPNSGDIVLARVTKIGQQNELELANGRRSVLFVDDEIIACYGDCHAPDQYDAQVPTDLESCDLVAAGGIASLINHRHVHAKPSTTLQPIGLLADSHQRRINLKDSALPKVVSLFSRPYTVAVVGTSMHADKTTVAANMIRGLTNAGYTVGAAKITGTASGSDTWLMIDAGAQIALDMIDAGFPSTYLASPEQVEGIVETLMTHLCVARVDAIVIDVGDSLFQRETAALLDSKIFTKTVDGIILAATDAMSAVSGVETLVSKKLPIIALGGHLIDSPLAAMETVSAIGLPLLDRAALGSSGIVNTLQIPLQENIHHIQAAG